ncbi:MAG: hypothetical protein IPF61_12540 [Xanthomonadales bacterium]|nr:hypothetical protein [Xanthomonadales bacterium]
MATIFACDPCVDHGLINDPNDMSTMPGFSAAQAAIMAIHASGSTQRIHFRTTAAAQPAPGRRTPASQR